MDRTEEFKKLALELNFNFKPDLDDPENYIYQFARDCYELGLKDFRNQCVENYESRGSYLLPDPWESGELGENPKHMQRAPDDQAEAIKKGIQKQLLKAAAKEFPDWIKLAEEQEPEEHFYDAELYNVTFQKRGSLTVAWGNIKNDKKNRFWDGAYIHTSWIVNLPAEGKKYIHTRNSVYKIMSLAEDMDEKIGRAL